MRLLVPFRAYVRDARAAFRLALLEVLLGPAVAAVFSWSRRSDTDEIWWRLATSAALALPALFALSVLRARGVLRAGQRRAAAGLVLAAAAAYGTLVFDPGLRAEAWRWTMLLGVAIFGVALLPKVGPAGEDADVRSWRFNRPLLAELRRLRGTGCDDAGGVRGTELNAEHARLPVRDAAGRLRGELLVTDIQLSDADPAEKGRTPLSVAPRVGSLHGLLVLIPPAPRAR